LEGPVLQVLYGGGGLKSSTPSKRKTVQGSMADEGDDNFIESCSEEIDMEDRGDGMDDSRHEREASIRRWQHELSRTTVDAAEDDRPVLLAKLKTCLEEMFPRDGEDIAQQD
jgi:hypothetical protein